MTTALACKTHEWTYEGTWSRDGARYWRRCRCGRVEAISRDRFFAAIGLLAIGVDA